MLVKMQLGVIALLSLLTLSYGQQDHSTCKKLCIKAIDRKYKGIDPLLSPIYASIPRCTAIYKNVTCYYAKRAPKNECQPLCLPTSTKIITEQLRTGPQNYKIIEGCQFMEATCKRCKRRSNIVKYFEFSKYERDVDIGRCVGQCDSESGGTVHGLCVPVKNTTLAIASPNGIVPVSVITKCSCESSCYRFSYQEAFLERNENNYPKITEKVIDIGKCIGSCNTILPGICLSRDRVTKRCLIKLPPKKSLCRPTSAGGVNFTRVDGKNITIPVIKECGCIYG